MNERYIKVFSGNEDLYVDDAPIMIRASALLKDTLTGKMIAQLKFQNISDNNIAYIKVRITQLDAINQQIDTPIDFEYLDILVSAKEEFGARTPIILSNPSARAFKVGVSCVGFSDGTVWKCENSDWVPALMGSPVMKKLAAEETYQDAKTLLAYNTRESLIRAKELFESISSIKDVTVEIGSCNDRILEFDIEEEKNKEKKKQKKKKTKKLAILIASPCVILCILASLGYFLIYPFWSVHNGNYSVFINMYNIEEYELPKGTTEIKRNAFYNCDSLRTIVIPDSVTTIEEWAFSNCSNLQNVTFGNSITSIGDSAFSDCSSLTSITLSSSITSIGKQAFSGCSRLNSITIPPSVTYIGTQAFSYCDFLANVFISDLTAWCNINFDFQGNFSASPLYNENTNLYLNGELITELVIPEGVENIGFATFDNCHNIKSVTIPDSVTTIGEWAFSDCTSLSNVKFSKNSKLKSIEDHAFSSCSSLKSFTVPDSVTKVSGKAFSACFGIEYFTFGSGLTNIEAEMFYNKSGLKTVTIPASVTRIGVWAFMGCSNLTNITFEGTVAEWNAITKGSYWASTVPATEVVCSDGVVKLN